MLARTHLLPVALFVVLTACGDQAGGAAASTTAAAASVAPTASARASAAPAAATASAASAPSLTPAAFCARADAIGKANLAKCNKDDENQRTYLDFKPAVAEAKAACEARVLSAQVDFHADVAAACLDAADKRGADTSFLTFGALPECRGVVTGKAAAGQPAKVVEECSAGLVIVDDKCQAPPAANAFCGLGTNLLGKVGDHPTCAEGLVCGLFGDGTDGQAQLQRCVPGAVGARCDAMVGNCPLGSTCYQGKCREQAELGAQCMHDGDCKDGLTCDIPGGLFGKCAAKKALGEKCTDHSNCASHHCRASKCTAFCAGG